jgi:hypothetical protein
VARRRIARGEQEVPVATRSRRSWCALLWGVLVTFACGYEGSTVVLVRVEPTVEPATSFPAQVLVAFSSSGSGSVVFRVGFLCAPPSVPFVVTAQFSDPTVDAASVVDAWLVPVDSGTPGFCGALPVPQPVPSPPPRPLGARASGNLDLIVSCGPGGARTAVLVLGGQP